MKSTIVPALALSLLAPVPTAHATDAKRDEFCWLGEINKASLVINVDVGRGRGEHVRVQRFASEVVGYAKKNNIKPFDFPYTEAHRIYKER